MDILIADSWLRDFLKTEATPKKIAECLSSSGPSVEKLERRGNDYVYYVEITTNRVDVASVHGIAREAAAILPRFNVKAKLSPLRTKTNQKFVNKVNYLKASVNHKLCPRFAAVLIQNVKIGKSPLWMQKRLREVNVRPINNIIDISNYIMHELGQPTHTFDYDKISEAKMILRPSKRGEKITTLDGKIHKLAGNDIVIEDAEGRLIDLAGIMGGENSAVDKNTKNVLFFVQTYNPVNIRRTSMNLAHRTEAAVLFEKGLDPELVRLGITRGIDLFVKLADGKPEKEILDLYPKPYKTKKVETDINFLNQRLGISLRKQEISRILASLEFENVWQGNKLTVFVPSFRASDIQIPEDLVEEVARIYGYYNLPSKLMTGAIPDPLFETPFVFERKLKNILKGWGAIEVYTLSMVPKGFANNNALKLINPLGKESEYMRTSLRPSLVQAAQENLREKDPFHLFEMANVYLAKKNSLPEERMILAGIFSNGDYRKAKGVVEGFLEELNIKAVFLTQDLQGFFPSQRLQIRAGGRKIGQFGRLEADYIYYEFDTVLLKKVSLSHSYTQIPKYPAQIEDLTLILPARTRIGDLISSITSTSKLINKIELTDIYKDAYTFRIWYQHPGKTLTDKEVEGIRKKALTDIKKKFGAVQKR